jgi:RHS repeat-associated protein
VWVNGTRVVTATYDAADQVVGWSYDAAGNLTSDDTATYAYDALNRVVDVTQGSQARTNTYNGDGVLVKQVANGTTMRYTQDLAAPLPQILQAPDFIARGLPPVNYIYGSERLAAFSSLWHNWYLNDALGSVRLMLSNSGGAFGVVNYDPWGAVENGTLPTFGFTGELQDQGGMVYLRARWYNAADGTFTSRDTFEGFAEQPSSLHPYQYALRDPIRNTDPTGNVAAVDGGGGVSSAACGTVSWRWGLDSRNCFSPYQLVPERVSGVEKQMALIQFQDRPCTPYAEIEVVSSDGKRLCVVNTIAMQFGVELDPGILRQLQAEPSCVQPSFRIETDGRIRLAAEDDEEKDKDGKPGGGPGGQGPSGPTSPSDPSGKDKRRRSIIMGRN